MDARGKSKKAILARFSCSRPGPAVYYGVYSHVQWMIRRVGAETAVGRTWALRFLTRPIQGACHWPAAQVIMQKSASTSFGSSSLPAPTTPRTPRTPSTLHFSSLFTLASSRPYRPLTSAGTTSTTSAIPRAENFGFGGAANIDDSFQDFHSTSTRSRRKNNSLGSAPNVLRKTSHDSLARKPSLSSLTSPQQRQQDSQQRDQHARFLGLRRRAISSSALRDRYGGAAVGSADYQQHSSSSSSASNSNTIFTDDSSPPALPDFAIASAAKLSRDPSRDTDGLPSSSSSVPARSYSGSYGSSNRKTNDSPKKKTNSMDSAGPYMQSGGRALNRAGTLPVNGYGTAGSGMMPPPSAAGLQGESSMVHQHITEMANKRISTLEYLRKAYVTLPSPPPLSMGIPLDAVYTSQ